MVDKHKFEIEFVCAYANISVSNLQVFW